MLYVRSLDVFILCNSGFVAFDQHLPIFSTSLSLVTNILFPTPFFFFFFLLSASMYLAFLDTRYKWDHAFFFFLRRAHFAEHNVEEFFLYSDSDSFVWYVCYVCSHSVTCLFRNSLNASFDGHKFSMLRLFNLPYVSFLLPVFKTFAYPKILFRVYFLYIFSSVLKAYWGKDRILRRSRWLMRAGWLGRRGWEQKD